MKDQNGSHKPKKRKRFSGWKSPPEGYVYLWDPEHDSDGLDEVCCARPPVPFEEMCRCEMPVLLHGYHWFAGERGIRAWFEPNMEELFEWVYYHTGREPFDYRQEPAWPMLETSDMRFSPRQVKMMERVVDAWVDLALAGKVQRPTPSRPYR